MHALVSKRTESPFFINWLIIGLVFSFAYLLDCDSYRLDKLS